jgi:ankyrin repeat protein
MGDIWHAVGEGDLAEMERLVGQDSGLLDATDGLNPVTPLMIASRRGHVGLVRWLLDKGAPVDKMCDGKSALGLACYEGFAPVLRLLLERGADPTIPYYGAATPLLVASRLGRLEAVRVLLGHPGARATINYTDEVGQTPLREACYWGHPDVARALLESGADSTIADDRGNTPIAIVKTKDPRLPYPISAEGRRECVAVLEVRFFHPLVLSPFPRHLLS